jgi:hypothetical protein
MDGDAGSRPRESWRRARGIGRRLSCARRREAPPGEQRRCRRRATQARTKRCVALVGVHRRAPVPNCSGGPPPGVHLRDLDGITPVSGRRRVPRRLGPYRRTTNGNQELALDGARFRTSGSARRGRDLRRRRPARSRRWVRADGGGRRAPAWSRRAQVRPRPGSSGAALAELPMGSPRSSRPRRSLPPPPARGRTSRSRTGWAARGGDEAPVAPRSPDLLRAGADSGPPPARRRGWSASAPEPRRAVRRRGRHEPADILRRGATPRSTRDRGPVRAPSASAGRIAFAGEHTAGPHIATMKARSSPGRAAQDARISPESARPT